jgi:hypothetical protein
VDHDFGRHGSGGIGDVRPQADFGAPPRAAFVARHQAGFVGRRAQARFAGQYQAGFAGQYQARFDDRLDPGPARNAEEDYEEIMYRISALRRDMVYARNQYEREETRRLISFYENELDEMEDAANLLEDIAYLRLR